jgi:hypothetical protein
MPPMPMQGMRTRFADPGGILPRGAGREFSGFLKGAATRVKIVS